VAAIVFKDYASITRIIELLVAKNFTSRSSHTTDRRRFELALTAEGKKLLSGVQQDVNENRNKALKGISKTEIENLRNTLNKIISNCII
jgi:DNA-binding MarR family transcriptional regulator